MSCGANDKGELVGVKGKKYFAEKPFGMTLVPGGSFIMGKSDDDLVGIEDAPTKTVTVRSFYMDETEITNSEYRQFVNWVRDSIIRTALAEAVGETLEGDAEGIDNPNNMNQFAYLGIEESSEEEDTGEFNAVKEAAKDKKRLNWGVELIFDENDYPSAKYKEIINDMRIKPEETFNNVAAWTVKDFKYKTYTSDIEGYLKLVRDGGYIYEVADRNLAVLQLEKYGDWDEFEAFEIIYSPSPNDVISMSEGEVFNIINKKIKYELIDSDPELADLSEDEINNFLDGELIVFNKRFTNDISKKDFMKPEMIEVYPDTTVWISDFKYSANQAMWNNYFSHDQYNDYPVVGITWDQARAFCEWRTDYKNGNQKGRNKNLVPKFRLPTEAEWEYAARGGLQGASYPWGGPYAKDSRGCYLANFKPMRGDYAADAALYTVEGDAYPANDYGLFNMSGNVAEWVDSSYESDAYEFSSTMNPNVNNKENMKKITRGGSWKDVKYYLQVGSRNYEYEDTPRSFIGFRTVHDYLGTDLTENSQTNTRRIKRKQ